MITSIILNSSNLLRNDIKGVNVLVPPLLSAIELILPLKELKFKYVVTSLFYMCYIFSYQVSNLFCFVNSSLLIKSNACKNGMYH